METVGNYRRKVGATDQPRYHVNVHNRTVVITRVHFTDLGDAQRYEDKIAAQNLYGSFIERCQDECEEVTL